MLKRICDRCATEIPVEQTMDDNELILRKINGKPFDLCTACQNELKEWFDNHGAMINSVTIDSDGTTSAQMIPKGFKVLEFVTLCRDCRFYDPRGQRCASLSFTVAPDFWCKHGKKTDVSLSIGGTDDKRNGDPER